jgi:hypothetical protein
MLLSDGSQVATPAKDFSVADRFLRYPRITTLPRMNTCAIGWCTREHVCLCGWCVRACVRAFQKPTEHNDPFPHSLPRYFAYPVVLTRLTDSGIQGTDLAKGLAVGLDRDQRLWVGDHQTIEHRVPCRPHCVRTCISACMCVCVRARAWSHVCECVGACGHACVVLSVVNETGLT